ncbi:hypothetical protein JCM10207_004895 [Rhodosporidiobolus poonsookiae]
MGIGGLLPLLKEIQKPCHVKDWAGKTVAVDAYVWLHRGAYGCAEDLALGKSTTKYVNYAMHRVRMLKYYGVTPLLVFDGGLLPSKMGTEDERERRRTDALAKGRAFLAEGKGSQARECFVKAVDITPAMAYQLIKALRQEGVQYVVAPYEADPQLCYLEKAGIVDAIVTEDSDLLVFGCRNVLFKLDGEGNCVSISRDDFSQCREYNLTGWSDAEFRHMAILSGCDYLDSIVGLGLKTAYRLMRKYKTAEKVVQFVRLEGQLTVPRNYLDEFRRAELTFQHQHVFDPVARKLTHLHPLPEGMSLGDLPFIGPTLEHEYACGVADGEIDPISKEAMVDLVPDSLATKPFQAEPFKPTASFTAKAKGKGKAAPEPVKGAGSILSFFSRQTATASTSTAVNPVKVVANQRRVHLLAATSERGKENGEPATPGRASRFFGGGGSGKGKGKAREVEPEPEMADDEGDEDAEAALRDVEMVEVQAPSSSELAAAGGDSTLDEGVITGVTNRSTDVNAEKPAAPVLPTPPRTSFREPSLPSYVSSPSFTPPARERIKLSHSPHAALGQLTEQDEGDARRDRKDDAPLTDVGISSPAESARGGRGAAQADEDDDGLSSPVVRPSSRQRAPVARRSSPSPSRVKVEKDVKPVVAGGSAAPSKAGKKSASIELSSDPIVLSSDAPLGDDDDGAQERTPRPAPAAAPKKQKSPRKAKQPAQSAEGRTKASPLREKRAVGSAVKVRSDEAAGGSAKGKGKGKKRAQVEEEEEAVDEAVKAVAASWRAKFMLPSAKTPQGKTAFGRSLLPTPSTTSRPPSLDKTDKATTSSSSPKKAARSLGRTATPASTTSKRLPLSPKSSNRIDRRPLPTSASKPVSPLKSTRSISLHATDAEDDPSASPPQAKKRRTSLLGSASASAPKPTSASPPEPHHGSSSSPVVVTNPRLLAFRFTGTVRKD